MSSNDDVGQLSNELSNSIIKYEEYLKELNELRGGKELQGIEQFQVSNFNVTSILNSYELDLPFLQKPIPQIISSLPISNPAPEIHSNIPLVHYAIEVRHLPLCKSLQSSQKFVTTKAWSLARDELKFSCCFERVMELRREGAWKMISKREEPKSWWDNLLEEVYFMSRDFEEEIAWKKSMAKLLAEEAKESLLSKLKLSPNSSHFYKLNRTILGEVKKLGIFAFGSKLVTCQDGILSNRSKSAIQKHDQNLITKFQKPVNTLKNNYEVEWSNVEDSLLRNLWKSLNCSDSFQSIADIINMKLYGGRSVRRPIDIYNRLLLSTDPSPIKSQVKEHLDRIIQMNSLNTKLIATKPTILPKKLCMTAHPSHEAAARKANQNISKLFTPQELALRRIQRTRVIADPTGAILTIPGQASSFVRQPPMPVPPPGSPSHRNPAPNTTNTAVNMQAYQVAQAAARQGISSVGISPNPNMPVSSIRPPMIVRPPMPTTIVQQQQRQALLNKSHQIGSYLNAIQGRPVASPLLRATTPASTSAASATMVPPTTSPTKNPVGIATQGSPENELKKNK